MSPTPALQDRVAIVSGGSGELGSAIAAALADVGASVVLAARDRVRLEETASRLHLPAERVLLRPTDVTARDEVESLVAETLARYGSLDVLVTAAGKQVRKPALDFSERDWVTVLDVNLTGTFLCCQAAAAPMIRQGRGRIIMISSLTAEIGLPKMAAYVASKGGVRQLCKALAVEWAPHGLTVNCLGPGRFRTRMTEDLFSDAAARESFLRLIPAGKAGLGADLGAAAVFLASDAAGYVTGQSLYVDGGWLAGGGNPIA